MVLSFTFLGFLPKHIIAKPDWLASSGVREICSVSNCISSTPQDWIVRLIPNGAGFYNTFEMAQSIIDANEKDNYEIFAYRMAPFQFDENGQVEFDPKQEFRDLGVEPDLSAWNRIGFDLVGYGSSSFFECSPLSCNSCAEDHQVNEYCLIDELDYAIEVGKEFGDPASHVEPAAYYLVEVLRQQNSTLK